MDKIWSINIKSNWFKYDESVVDVFDISLLLLLLLLPWFNVDGVNILRFVVCDVDKRVVDGFGISLLLLLAWFVIWDIGKRVIDGFGISLSLLSSVYCHLLSVYCPSTVRLLSVYCPSTIRLLSVYYPSTARQLPVYCPSTPHCISFKWMLLPYSVKVITINVHLWYLFQIDPSLLVTCSLLKFKFFILNSALTMATTLKKLKQIDNRFKDTVFGYVRSINKSNNSSTKDKSNTITKKYHNTISNYRSNISYIQ